ESRVTAGAGGCVAADPWGLERRGDDIAELQPGVNSADVHKQRHVWLMREACRYCQTYDAFCRISMSAVGRTHGGLGRHVRVRGDRPAPDAPRHGGPPCRRRWCRRASWSLER
ncbi:unnamed protein product, partial [Prorocentrum cordatum]